MDRICVFCGSNAGHDPVYREAAAALGRELAARDIDLVFGGGGVGLMGALAEATLEHGGSAYGVMPEGIADREQPPDGLTELYLVESMHERKQRMFDLAEGFVALPGGIGTMEEFFEMVTWSQLGFHDYPTGIINVDDFFGELVAFLDGATADGFIDDAHRNSIRTAEDPATLLDDFEAL